MGFFSSLHQINKNSKNFEQWEKEQDRRQAQREALYQKREYSEEELAKAKALGKNIINVIDTMDNHSESVAENVETALAPVVAATPFLSSLGVGAFATKKFILPANNDISREGINFLNSEKVKQLSKEIKEYQTKINDYHYIDLTSKHSIEHIKDSELKNRAKELYQTFEKTVKPFKTKRKWALISIPVTFILSFIGANIYAAKVQVDSSKVARYQARKYLEDPKAFVEYTPEQIQQAQEELAKLPKDKRKNKKDKKELKNGMFSSIFSVLKDLRKYKKEKELDNDDSKIVTRPLTKEEQQQAERDQEVIQRTVKLINNKAEFYSENMETAAGVIMNGTPILGATVGGFVTWILNKTGVIPKIVEKRLKGVASEETMNLYKEMSTETEGKRSLSRMINNLKKWGQFTDSLLNDVKNSSKKTVGQSVENVAGKGRKLHNVKSSGELKALKTALLANKRVAGWAIAGASALVTGLAGMFIGLKLQKSAARAGRYTAKRELEEDPRNFIGYSQDDFKEVEDVKNTKKKPSKFKEFALFIPTVIKQYFAYNKYRKNEFEKNQELNKQLQKMDVSEKQLRDAKNLQRKLFNTFEKVDDNSQQYSESMEAAIEIAQPFVMYGAILATLAPLAIIGRKVAKGKLTVAQLTNKVTGWLSNSTKLMKSKFFKKYLKDVDENIAYKIEHTEVKSKPLGALLENVDLQKDSLIDVLEKTFGNIKNLPKEIDKLSEWQINDFIYELRNNKMLESDTVKKFLTELSWTDKKTKIQVLNIILNPKSIKDMPKEEFTEAKNAIMQLFKLDNIALTGIKESAEKILDGNAKIQAKLDEFFTNIANSEGNLSKENLTKLIQEFKQSEFYTKLSDHEIPISTEALEQFKDNIKDEDTIEALKKLMSSKEGLNIKPKAGETKATLKDLLDTILPENITEEEFAKITQKFKGSKEIIEKTLKENVKLPNEIEEILQQIAKGEDVITQENITKTIEAYESLIKKLNSASTELKESEWYQKILNSEIPVSAEVISKIKNAVKKPEDLTEAIKKLISSKKGLDINPEAGQTKATLKDLLDTLTPVKNYTIKDYLSFIPKELTNPKKVLGGLKAKIEKMSEEEFLSEIASKNYALRSFDKKTTLEIISKLDKIIDNLPKEELLKIKNTIIKEFNEHPDEFIKLVKEGRVGDLFRTPALENALAIAGISWITFNIIITYVIESWLADLQLKAGRLGVMKSLEELQDPRYYANIEPETK